MKGAIVALAMLSGVSHGFVAPNSASSPRAAKASASSAARNNYYNTLSQAEKLDQLARCRFMDRSEFDDGIAAIADVAATVNERSADIGARRLHTVMERLLETLSFEAPDLGKQRVVVDRAMVEERLGELLDDQDLSQFIL